MLFRRPPSLSAPEAAAAMGRGELQLIDVREHAELRRGRVDGARHIPLGELERRLSELDRDMTVGFLCHSGSRSGIATKLAIAAGVNAVNVKGGMIAWSAARLPVTTQTKRGSRPRSRGRS